MAGLKIAECMSEYDEFRQGFEDSSPSIPFQFVRKLAKEGKLPGNRCYLPELENDLDDGSQKRIGEIQQYQQHSAANCKVMGGMARFVDITEQDDEEGMESKMPGMESKMPGMSTSLMKLDAGIVMRKKYSTTLLRLLKQRPLNLEFSSSFSCLVPGY